MGGHCYQICYLMFFDKYLKDDNSLSAYRVHASAYKSRYQVQCLVYVDEFQGKKKLHAIAKKHHFPDYDLFFSLLFGSGSLTAFDEN